MQGKYGMTVFGTCQFEAIHNWPEAGYPVQYLQFPHRHVFHIEFTASVEHEDRQIEFITLKQMVENFCRDQWHNRDIGRTSCETIGVAILEAFQEIDTVTVSEDGENGATIWRKEQL